jgi:hypothetical protein
MICALLKLKDAIVRERLFLCGRSKLAKSSPLDNNGPAKRRCDLQRGSADTKSHFSALLDQHYP